MDLAALKTFFREYMWWTTQLNLIHLSIFFFRQRDPNQDQDVSIQSTEDASITRNFRYMRRKPTIISYQPPPGDLDEDGNQLPQLSDIVVDSDHMILDRIQGNSILYQPFISYQPPSSDLDENGGLY